MTIAQLLRFVERATVRKAAELSIREVEEERKGHWIAFVDDKEESYDVQIVIDGKQVLSRSCECEIDNIVMCSHQTKLLMAIDDTLKGKKAMGKPVLKKPIVKKKMSESVALLHKVNQEEVYGWLAELFKKNKDIEQQFILTFKKQDSVEYSVDIVDKILKDTYISVFGKRKNADAKDIKKLVDLLSLALEPVDKYIVINITKPIALELYLKVMSSLFSLKYSVNYTSKRVDTYMDKFVERYTLALLNVKNQDVVKKTIVNLLEQLYEPKNSLQYSLVSALVIELYESKDERYTSLFGDEVVKIMKYYQDNNYVVEIEMYLFFLIIAVEQQVLKDCYKLFKPIRFQNEYNLLLLKGLMDIDLKLVEEYCLKIIEGNIQTEYNEPYLEILEEIYENNGDKRGLANIKKQLFFETYDLEDYNYVIKYLEDTEEIKKFRTKVLVGLKNNFHHAKTASMLYFAILETEHNYKKMLEVLSRDVPQDVMWAYGEQMCEFNAKSYLDKVMSIGQTSAYSRYTDERLAEFIVDKFSAKDILQKLMKYKYTDGSLNKVIKTLIEKKQN